MNSARERGAALLIAVLMVAALAGIAAAVVLAVAGGGSMARNEQWGETAAARAEAGLEFAKTVLAAHARAADGSLEAALPPARPNVSARPGQGWGAALPRDRRACRDPGRAGCRDYERFLDETTAAGTARIYVGRVLRDPAGRALLHDPRAPRAGWSPDLDRDGEPDLAGVTVWVRRPLVGGRDAEGSDRAVVTAEGTFPPPSRPDDPHAVVRLELALRVAPRPSREAEDSGEGYSDVLKNRGPRPGGSSRRKRP